MDIAFSFVAALLTLFIVPVLIYSLFVKFAGLKEPYRKLGFMVSVLVQKVGTTLGFIAIFVIGKEHFMDSWLVYGLIWSAMFAIVEIGQAIGPDYSKEEAAAGIISEFIYFPLAAFFVYSLLT